VVVDCTNPLREDVSGLALGYTTSGAEQVAEWAKGAKVFKAFNQTGFNNMADPTFDGQRAVMFVCGDDDAQKPTVLKLAADIGFEAIERETS
jgi:8-hydroxy-5-deazaflavin:NADPH oxidoreductase